MCLRSYVVPLMQQSKGFLPSSSRDCGSGRCYCMATGSHAEHTCPATCLHHRARAGRDAVGHCLQWSDYAPVLRRVQSSSGCSRATRNICQPGGDDTGGLHIDTQLTLVHAKAPLLSPHMSALGLCCCGCSNSGRMKRQQTDEKQARSLFLKTPVSMEREGKRHKGCGERHLKKHTHPLSVARESPKG